MRNRYLLLVITLALLILTGKPLALKTAASGPSLFGEASAVPSVETGPESIILNWTLPAYSVKTVSAKGQTFSQIEIEGLPLSAEPGQPQLPHYSRLIGLPPTGSAVARIVNIERETINLAHTPAPAPAPDRRAGAVLNSVLPAQPGPMTLDANWQTYAKNAPYPANIVSLSEPEIMRFNRLARLSINPVQVNPVSGEASIVRSISVEISFDQPVQKGVTPAITQSGPFAQALKLTLLNPEAVNWTLDTRQKSAPANISAGKAGNELKVLVGRADLPDTLQAGLFAITYADLQNAGFPVDTLNPQTFQMSHGPIPRTPVDIIVEGEEDGSFDSTDRILFYADPEFSRYTVEDVYFLSYGGPAGSRMSSRSGDPTGLPAGMTWLTAHTEENYTYDSLYPAYNGDHFFWEELRTVERPGYTTEFSLFQPVTTTNVATLTVWLQGKLNPPANPAHRVAVEINGSPVGETSWNYDKAVQASFPVTPSILLDGVNQLDFSLPDAGSGPIEYAWIDAYDITYAANPVKVGQPVFKGEPGQNAYTLSGWNTDQLTVYDVSNPYSPQLVTNVTITQNGATYNLTFGDANPAQATYMVVTGGLVRSPVGYEPVKDMNVPANGADYIIISHPDFLTEAATFAAHKQSTGLSVAVVDVQAIYNAYGAGRMDPATIKAFLTDAFNNWTTTPQYVLLVGDGHYDFKNYYNYQTYNGQPWPILIPPNLVDEVDPWLSETASDNQLANVVGGGRLPEMLIGRIPVNTAAEASLVFNKSINYEANPPLGDWNSFQVFVADNSPDPAGNFYADSNAGYNRWQGHPSLVGQRFYYTKDPLNNASYFYLDPVTLRQEFLAKFNQGMGMVTYHGHSSWHQWAEEQLLRWSVIPADNDIITMSNGDRLPVVLQMTCFTGFFHQPEFPTMDEAMLRQPGGGAVAIWGATGEGVSTGHSILQSGFYDAVIDQAETNFGASTLTGKLKLYANGFNGDLIDTFGIMGDPALNIDFNVVLFTDYVYLPLVMK